MNGITTKRLDGKPFVREVLVDAPVKPLKAVRSDVHASLYKIIYEGGGVVPECLREAYNRRSIAEAAIFEYNKTRKPARIYLDPVEKEETNATHTDKVRV